MVNGDKEVVDALLHHPFIQGISFVGSSRVGHYVYHEGAKHKKRVQAQAGAKNHLVVMPDAVLRQGLAELDQLLLRLRRRALPGRLRARVRGRRGAREGVGRFQAEGQEVTVGYGLDERVGMGPVISRQGQGAHPRSIEKGIEEGATLLLDGRRPKVITPGCEDGYFIGPTISTTSRPT